MKRTDKNIDSWIKPYATVIGDDLQVDKALKEINPAQYFLRLTQPDRFESYAIILHSFWINRQILDSQVSKLEFQEDKIEDNPSENYYSPMTWKDFLKLKELEFDLNTAILDLIYFRLPFEQLNNELYPGGGLMDKNQLVDFINVIIEIYGDQDIEAFYCFLATDDWKNDRMYEGKISSLTKLIDIDDLVHTPNLIYPKDKSWCINTDYDLPFSTIGGDKELIEKLMSQREKEIYEVIY